LRRLIPLRLIIDLDEVSVGVAKLIGRPMAEFVLDPADARACVFERLHPALQRLRASRAEAGVTEPGGLGARQLQGVALIVVPAAQEDAVPGATAFRHAHDIDEEVEALLGPGRQQFEMPEVGDVEDGFFAQDRPPVCDAASTDAANASYGELRVRYHQA
jgi:hypothetical protein